MSIDVAPGWYPDPSGTGLLRYWDGGAWTGHTHPGALARAPRSRRRTFGIVALIVAVIALLVVGGYSIVTVHDRPSATPTTPTTSPQTSPVTTPLAQSSYAPRMSYDGDPVLVPFPMTTPESTPARTSAPGLYAVPSGRDVVTPASARAVATTIWNDRAAALSAGRYAQLGAFETGSALEDDASHICVCGSTDHYGPVQSMTVAVPHFARFPARFLAAVSTTFNGQHWLSILIMTRATSAQPWRLAFAGGYSPADPAHPFVHLLIGPDGYSPPMAPGALFIARQQPAALAAYWQSWIDNGIAPRVVGDFWMNGPMTNQYGQSKADDGLQGQVNAVNGLIGHYVFQQDTSGGTYVFPIGPDEELVCAPIFRQATWSGATKNDGPYQSANQDNWGNDVPTGIYRAVITDYIASPCIDVVAEDNYVLGVAPDTVADVGVP